MRRIWIRSARLVGSPKPAPEASRAVIFEVSRFREPLKLLRPIGLSFLSHASSEPVTGKDQAKATVDMMTAIKNPDGSERLISKEDVEEISEKTAQLMRLLRHGGHRGRTALAAVTRVSETQLKRYEDKEDPLIIPLDIVMELEVLLDHPALTQMMADIHGYDLVKRNAGRGEALLTMLSKGIKESAEAHEAILEAEADGVKTLDEWRSIKKEAADAKDIYAVIEAKANRNIKRMLEAQ